MNNLPDTTRHYYNDCENNLSFFEKSITNDATNDVTELLYIAKWMLSKYTNYVNYLIQLTNHVCIQCYTSNGIYYHRYYRV